MKKQSIKEFRERVEYLALNRTMEVAFRQANREHIKLYGVRKYVSYASLKSACTNNQMPTTNISTTKTSLANIRILNRLLSMPVKYRDAF